MSSYNNHNDYNNYNNHNNYNNYSNHNENYNAKYGVKSCKRNIKKIIMRAVALLMCGACLITCLSIFFENFTSGTTAYADDVTVTYTSGSATGSNVTDTATYDTRLYSLLLLDWDGFGYDNFATSSVSSGSDGVNFGNWTYTANSGTVDGTYTPAFAGWKLTEINGSTYTGTTTYIYPDNDYIYFNDEPFASYASITSLTFEAVWGRTVYLRDQYNFNDLGNVYGDDSGIAIAEIDWDTNTTYSSDSNTGASASSPVASLSQAETLLNKKGGKIVIVNHYTLEAPDGYYYTDWSNTDGATYDASKANGATARLTNSPTTYVGSSITSGVLTISGLNQGDMSGEGKISEDSSYYTHAYLYSKMTRGNGYTISGSTKTTYSALSLSLYFTCDTVIEGLNFVSYRESWNLNNARSTTNPQFYSAENKRFVTETTFSVYKRETDNTTGADYGESTTNWLHAANTSDYTGITVPTSTFFDVINYVDTIDSNTQYNNMYLTLRGSGDTTSFSTVMGIYYKTGTETYYDGDGNTLLCLNNIHINLYSVKVLNLYASRNPRINITFVGVGIDSATISEFAPVYANPSVEGQTYTTEITTYNVVVKNTKSDIKTITRFHFGAYDNSATLHSLIVKYKESANLYLEDGKINNIFGGGYNIYCTTKGEFNYYLNGGTVVNFYGGGQGGFIGTSTEQSTININVDGCTVTNLYGGGSGGLTSVSSSSAVMTFTNARYIISDGDYTVDIDADNQDIAMFVYDKTSSIAYVLNHTDTARGASYKVYSIDLNGSYYTVVSYDSVYLQSGTNYANYGNYYRYIYNYVISDAAVYADITITVSSGTITYLYGGGGNGSVTGDITINITGGTISTIYGGGYGNSSSFSWKLNGRDMLTFVFTDDTSNLTASTFATLSSNSNAYTLFNEWLREESLSVTLDYFMTGDELLNSAYYSSSDNCVYIYTAVIDMLGTIVGDVTINISGGTITTVYGGSYGEVANIVGDTEINITGGSISGNVYGGGVNGNVSGNTTINISNGTVSGSIYGGGLNAAVGTATTTNDIKTTSVNITGGSVTGIVYGGGNRGAASATSVSISGGSISYLYGGGYQGAVNNGITITVSGGTISNSLYGGGSQGDVTGDITVNISGGNLRSYVFGGCYKANVNGNITVNITGTGDTISNVFGGNNDSGDISGTITVNISGSSAINNLYGAVTRQITTAPRRYILQAAQLALFTAAVIVRTSEQQTLL